MMVQDEAPTFVQGYDLKQLLVLSALAGIGYRKRAQAPVLIPVVFVLLLVSVVTVYTKPFLGN